MRRLSSVYPLYGAVHQKYLLTGASKKLTRQQIT